MLLPAPEATSVMLTAAVSGGPIEIEPAPAVIESVLTFETAIVFVTPPPLLVILIVPLVELLPPVTDNEPTPFAVADPMLKTWALLDVRSMVPPVEFPFALKLPLTWSVLAEFKFKVPPLPLPSAVAFSVVADSIIEPTVVVRAIVFAVTTAAPATVVVPAPVSLRENVPLVLLATLVKIPVVTRVAACKSVMNDEIPEFAVRL